MFQLEYLFNGTLQILAIRITVEKGNQSSLPKTFICVVAILFETINVTCCDTCILNKVACDYGWQVSSLVVTSLITRLEVEQSFA